MVCGRWRSERSWRTGLLGVAKWRGVGVYLVGTSVWQGQLYLRRREGLDQSWRCCCSSDSLLASFIQVVCLTTGPKPLPKPPLHIVRSRASSFKWGYPLLSLRLSSSVLRLLPRLPVTSILPFIFPSLIRCRRQFPRKMWPIQFAFRLRTSCRIFLCSLTLIYLHFSHDQSNWSFQSFFSTIFQNIPGVSDLLP